MNGIERVRRAIARAGGYEWCEEHSTYRYWSASACDYRHSDTRRGYFFCPEHGRVHAPDERAWYC